jgi:ABC-type polar amino acid transport system ATPase subunit
VNLIAFQIRNFRSIVDSGKIPFSPDGITVFVGQNESGKSSVLDALFFALSTELPTEDDLRIGAEMPSVDLKVEVSFSEIEDILDDVEGCTESIKKSLEEHLVQNSNVVTISVEWEQTEKDGQPQIIKTVSMESQKLEERLEACALIDTLNASAIKNGEATSVDAVGRDSPQAGDDFTSGDFAYAIWMALPLGVRFTEEHGALPNHVDIDEKGKPTGPGAKAAENFLRIAEIDLPALIKGDLRTRQNTINRANSKVSADFRLFWSQTIGNSGFLTLKCEIGNYPVTETKKSGKPHLIFWICDGNTQLYPAQRSRGTRWFVSFYLQLKASEKAKIKRVFLLDEPGANLHSKAQGDVLKLINMLAKDTSLVVYSTHSPQLLEYAKLFRVHAVQRNGDQEDSPTSVIDAHHLGAASSDTLSPVLAAMGVDFSHNRVVKKENNVLLEEMSGYYYISSFWKLTGQKKPAHFIAATGVNKIEALANMFRGWGLDFLIAVDDDKAGREAYKSIKKEMFGDVEEIANKSMVRFSNCPSIEDVFSLSDFKKFVLQDETAVISSSNGDYLKTSGRSKPVLSFQFFLKVEDGKITLDQLDQTTQKTMLTIVEQIATRLNPRSE